MKRCVYCDSKIKSPNKKLILTDDKSNQIYTCSEGCKQKIDSFHKNKKFLSIVSKLELVLGLSGIVFFMLKWTLATEIVLGIDGLLMITFPEAGFKEDRQNVGLEKFKTQSRAFGGIILIMLFAVLTVLNRK
ncbi:hypothetical protein [Asaccharospora irregularis]|uniref:Uncharacterized protein n=1 Tax=Asaccharospora irregularis DSM 2635 TaxID=1121321 RepID=A0A1M5J6V6_9FIRM|nr:hypothetical protein [Asaccharospora irregularis]SHG36095.1 hypothetical protein SAMN04488530_10111 [Asaccharospora irregularis DSM 2635]